MLRQLGVLPIHALGHAGVYSFSVCKFSWKSRQNRDPDLRERKKELLEKRYTLRRIDVLEDSAEDVLHLEEVSLSIEKIMSQFRARLGVLKNVSSIDKLEVARVRIGSSTLMQIASLAQPNSRTVVIVAKDRGSVDLIFKFVKRANPLWETTLIDRERIEVSVPSVPIPAVKEQLIRETETLVALTQKALKKSELLFYKRIRNSPTLCESIKAEFSKAQTELEKLV